jgi:hypothetical protein
MPIAHPPPAYDPRDALVGFLDAHDGRHDGRQPVVAVLTPFFAAPHMLDEHDAWPLAPHVLSDEHAAVLAAWQGPAGRPGATYARLVLAAVQERAVRRFQVCPVVHPVAQALYATGNDQETTPQVYALVEAYMKLADVVVVGTDLGIDVGMQTLISMAASHGLPVFWIALLDQQGVPRVAVPDDHGRAAFAHFPAPVEVPIQVQVQRWLDSIDPTTLAGVALGEDAEVVDAGTLAQMGQRVVDWLRACVRPSVGLEARGQVFVSAPADGAPDDAE